MKMFIARIRWASQSWPLSLPTLYFLFPFIPWMIFCPNYFLFSGTVLEVGAILVAIRRVDETLKAFGQPGLFRTIRNYFKAFPRQGENRIANLSASSAGFSTGYAAGHRTIKDINSLPVPEALEFLNTELDRLRDQAFEKMNRIQKEINTLSGKVSTVTDAIQKKIDEFYANMKKIMASGYKVELCGALFLIIGIVYNNLNEQMATFYNLFK